MLLLWSRPVHVSLVPSEPSRSLPPAAQRCLVPELLIGSSARAAGVHCIGFSPAAQAKKAQEIIKFIEIEI
jgi:hypothetical protein